MLFTCATSLLLCLAATPPQAAAPAADKAAANPLFAHIVVLGGDVSEGFGLERELGAPGSLADVIEASILTPHQPIEKRTAPWGPASSLPELVRGAAGLKPTLVVAIDYLIAPAYFDAETDDLRIAGVDKALQALEHLSCPILLGDVPDFARALAAEKPVLDPKRAPSPEGLKTIGAHVEQWSAAHKNVVITPFAAWMHAVTTEEPFTIRDTTWFKSWISELVQKDRVHPRLQGTISLWLASADALCNVRGTEFAGRTDPAKIDWDPRSIYQKVYASKEAERQVVIDREIQKQQRPAPPRPPRPPPPPSKEEMEKQLREKNARGGG
jgi:hypothetical protein